MGTAKSFEKVSIAGGYTQYINILKEGVMLVFLFTIINKWKKKEQQEQE